MNALWLSRLRAALATLRYREAWRLPRPLARTMRDSLRYLRPVSSGAGIVLHAYVPPIGGKAFARYLAGLGRMARGERVPLVVHLSLSGRCHNRCTRCSNLRLGEEEPTTAQLCTLITRLKEAGTVLVAFTGGEPLLRTDLEQCVAACGQEIATTLFTTGEGCSFERARQLRKAGLDMAFVSLDSRFAQCHDALRGRHGAFEDALQAIEAFRQSGVYTAAQAVVEPELLVAARGEAQGEWEEELERFAEFCRALGVDELMLLEPVAVCRAAGPSEAGETLRARLRDLQLRSARTSSLLKVNSMAWLEAPEQLGCQAGFSFLYVHASGELFPCDFVPLSVGNVYREPLGELLERLGRVFARPARRCLAQRLIEAGKLPVSSRVLAWQEVEECLKAHQRCGIPDLLSWSVPGEPSCDKTTSSQSQQ